MLCPGWREANDLRPGPRATRACEHLFRVATRSRELDLLWARKANHPLLATLLTQGLSVILLLPEPAPIAEILMFRLRSVNGKCADGTHRYQLVPEAQKAFVPSKGACGVRTRAVSPLAQKQRQR
jgi:hypothetical protein